MRNRIHTLFEKKQSQIISVYFTAGFPSLNDTPLLIKHLEEAGADMIEIGIPFSDPLADGPVIQKSNLQSLSNGMNLKILFKQLENLRSFCSIPVLLMGYLNPVMQFGETNFVESCTHVGVDGFIIPDMPLDYYSVNLHPLCLKHNLSNIMLITPETKEKRIREIDKCANGFIYMVSSNSITGSHKNISSQKDYFNRISKMALNNPALIGFGIHNNETFENACKYSSGAIVGSAFINHISKHGIDSNSVNQFINSFKL